MDIGMLWFDDSPRSIDEKIKRAVAFYANKYGRTPTLCMVHPSTAQDEGSIGGVQVRPARTVLPHHFLVGIEDSRPNGKEAPVAPRLELKVSQPAQAGGPGDRQLELDLADTVGQVKTNRPKRRRPAIPALDGQAA